MGLGEQCSTAYLPAVNRGPNEQGPMNGAAATGHPLAWRDGHPRCGRPLTAPRETCGPGYVVERAPHAQGPLAQTPGATAGLSSSAYAAPDCDLERTSSVGRFSVRIAKYTAPQGTAGQASSGTTRSRSLGCFIRRARFRWASSFLLALLSACNLRS
jgi:hypothetical protein